jgi:hypothetical protein
LNDQLKPDRSSPLLCAIAGRVERINMASHTHDSNLIEASTFTLQRAPVIRVMCRSASTNTIKERNETPMSSTATIHSATSLNGSYEVKNSVSTVVHMFSQPPSRGQKRGFVRRAFRLSGQTVRIACQAELQAPKLDATSLPLLAEARSSSQSVREGCWDVLGIARQFRVSIARAQPSRGAPNVEGAILELVDSCAQEE